MPGFSAEAPHSLGTAEAMRRLDHFADFARNKYGEQVTNVNSEWQDNVLNFSLTTFGLTITCQVVVEDTVARDKGNLPLAALPFRGTIEQAISDELQKALA